MVEKREKWFSLLVEKTGQTEGEIQKQLDELKERLGETARTGSELKIEGFGAFSGRYGALYFEPSERLATEINQKYAGMSPIELVEAFRESGAGIPVENMKTSPIAHVKDENSIRQDPSKEHKEQKQQDEGEAVKVPAAASASVENPNREADEGSKLKIHNRNYRKRRPNIGVWAAVAAGIIIILAGGWALFGSKLMQINNDRTKQNVAAVDSTQNRSAFGSSQPRDQPKDTVTAVAPNSTPDSLRGKVDPAPRDTIAAAKYGLKGAINPIVRDAYTIVIHSFRLHSTVQTIADSLQQKGYRAVTFRGANKSGIHWRVGLGQFKTIKDAQKAVQKLPERYQNAHFIHRINH
jgi:cell division septation protein DedD